MCCPRSQMPNYLGQNYTHPGGFMGSYVPAQQYVQGCQTTACCDGVPCQRNTFMTASCGDNVQRMGACSAGFGLSSNQLCPALASPCDGFDQVLVSAPFDLLYGADMMDDVNVLTTTRNQSRDLRGEPAIQAMFSCNEKGQTEVGPFGGVAQSSIGPYQMRAPVRFYTV